MKYAAVFVDFMRAAPAAVASATAVGAWTRLYTYAAMIESQGRIPSCANYGDHEWTVIAHVKAAEVDAALAAGLVRWEGSDLLVLGYDLDGEAKVAACRNNGKQPPRPGKKRRGRPRKDEKAPEENSNENQTLTAPGKPNGKPSENPSPYLSFPTSPLPPSPTGGGGSGSTAAAEPAAQEQRADPDQLAATAGPPDDAEHARAIAAAIDAFRTARRSAHQANPRVRLDEPAADLRELTDDLRRRNPAQLPHVGRAARTFFRRRGKKPGDLWFEAERWSMHAFASQGLESCIHDAMSGARIGDDGFPIARPARQMEELPDLAPPARRPTSAPGSGSADRDAPVLAMRTGKATA